MKTRINENQKVTLTLRQLKRLVKESGRKITEDSWIRKFGNARRSFENTIEALEKFHNDKEGMSAFNRQYKSYHKPDDVAWLINELDRLYKEFDFDTVSLDLNGIWEYPDDEDDED